jgi:hypothetical protein
LAGPLNLLAIVPAATVAVGIISRRAMVPLLCGLLMQITCLIGYFVGGGSLLEEDLLIIIPAILATGPVGAACAALVLHWAAKMDH